MNKTLQQSQKNLEELFDLFNEKLYNGELERPIISIQSDTKNNCYGWCTTYKAWSTNDNEEYYEINLCAEYMTRSIFEICSTLLHEMARSGKNRGLATLCIGGGMGCSTIVEKY